MEQQNLVDMPAQPVQAAGSGVIPTEDKPLKLRLPDRQQSVFTTIHPEDLIPADHKARAIAQLVEKRFDTQAFYAGVKTREGEAGCAKLDPKMLVSILVYAYSEGIGSMRLVSRRMGHDPGLMWLSGLTEISHTVLSDFRREHQKGLEGVFVQLLAILDEAEIINLEEVTLDGMRVRAYAGVDTFRRKKTIEKRLEQARATLKKLEAAGEQEQSEQRRQVAQRRAAEAMKKRLEESEKQFEQAHRNLSEAEKEKTRISTSEPEARILRTSDGGFAPAHNVQLVTDAKNKVIVNLEVTNSGQDGEHLQSALEGVEQNLGRKPEQVLADAAYMTQSNLGVASQSSVEMLGPLPDNRKQEAAGLNKRGIDPALGRDAFVWDPDQKVFRCPEGKALTHQGYHSKDRDRKYDVYRAAVEDCTQCPRRAQCVGQDAARVLQVQQKNPLVAAHAAKMASEPAQTTYKKRGAVAEFPHAWIKEKIGLRKFHLSGLTKATIEAMWACLTYNVMIWRRLVWLPELKPAT